MFFSIPMREATACDRLVEKFPPRLIRRSNPARAVGGTQKNGMGRPATRSCASISTSMSSPSTPHPHASRALHRPRGVGTDGPSRPTPSSPSAEVSTRRTTPFSYVGRRTSNVERRMSNVERRTSNVERRLVDEQDVRCRPPARLSVLFLFLLSTARRPVVALDSR